MSKNDRGSVLIICTVCLLLMMPRILSAQFGLLDDAVVLLSAVQPFRDPGFILHGFENAGRFLPTVLLFRAVVFSFSDFDPQRWYIWQTIILIFTCLELAFVARQYVPGKLSMVLSVLFFLVSPTLIENFYTLSKSEIYLLLFVASAILLATSYSSWQNRYMKIFVVALCYLFLLFGFGAKETALVLPFIFLSWFIVSWIYYRKAGEYRELLRSDLILFVGALISGVLYLIFRYISGLSDLADHSYSGGYQLFNLPKIFFNLENLSGWLIRDYPYLIPVVLAALFLKPLRQAKVLFIVLRWIIWMITWVAILLPWGYLSYYFLPFLFGAALLSGTILSQMLVLLYSEYRSGAKTPSQTSRSVPASTNKNLIFIFCIATLILAIPSMANASTYATTQLTLDKANWQFVEQASKLPPNSRLLINIPAEMEYFYEIQLFVGSILDRPDISIESFQTPVLLNPDQDTYIASPFFDNQVRPSVRSIKETSVDESRNAIIPEIDNSQIIYSDRIARPLFDIGLHRILFFLGGSDMMGYSERDIFTITTLVYGWDLWEYSP